MLRIRLSTSGARRRNAVRTKRNINRRRRSAGGQGMDVKKPTVSGWAVQWLAKAMSDQAAQ